MLLCFPGGPIGVGICLEINVPVLAPHPTFARLQGSSEGPRLTLYQHVESDRVPQGDTVPAEHSLICSRSQS